MPDLPECLAKNRKYCLRGPKLACMVTKLGMGVQLSSLKALCVGYWAGMGGWCLLGVPVRILQLFDHPTLQGKEGGLISMTIMGPYMGIWAYTHAGNTDSFL